MKVLLIDNVENVGRRGDIKEVKDGFARNHLLPKNFAIRATDANIKSWEKRLHALKLKDAKVLEDAQAIASSLNDISITIAVKAGEDDKLFGSVSSQNIADSLNEKEFNISRKDIQLKEPIKQLGEHSIPIKIHPEVTANITLKVVREDDASENKEE